MEGVMIVREDDVGMYRCKKSQKQTVNLTSRLTDDVELRENQAEHMYQSAFKALLESADDASGDFILSNVSGASGSSPARPMLISNQAGSSSQTALSQSSAPTPNIIPVPKPKENEDDDDDIEMTSGLLKLSGSATPASSKAKAKAVSKVAAKAKSGSRSLPSHEPQAAAGTGTNEKITKNKRRQANKTPEDDGKEPHPKRARAPGGRQSAAALTEGDEELLEECTNSLNEITQDEIMGEFANETELVNLSKNMCDQCQEISGKLGQNIAKMKRRKQAQSEQLMDKMQEQFEKATLFSNLFGELASTAPKAQELKSFMASALQRGFDCGVLAHIKLLRAECNDMLKFGRYQGLVDRIVETSANLEKKYDVDTEYLSGQFSIVLEQIFQKLMRNLTQNQARFGTPQVQNLRQFVESVSDCEQLSLPSGLLSQFQSLQVLLAHDDKSILPNKILDAVQSIRKACPLNKMFCVISALPQGRSLIAQAEERARSRLASDSCLEELSYVSSKLTELTANDDPLPHVDDMADIWCKINKLKRELADKEELPLVEKLEVGVKAMAESVVARHSEEELPNFVSSQCMHSDQKMKCLDKPMWKLDRLQQHIPEHFIFRIEFGKSVV